MTAYGQIADFMPRFDRLGMALIDKPDFQQVLAVVYSDILEFHKHSYKFFKRNGESFRQDFVSISLTITRLDMFLQVVMGPVRRKIQLHFGQPDQTRQTRRPRSQCISCLGDIAMA
jgi:hypothetical protein